MDAKELGRYGEQRAAAYLRLRGYRVREMNYRCRLGEIDIIAEKGRYIVFAEVKLRKNDAFAEAREFVSYSKQRRIISAARLWLAGCDCELQPRFDVIEIYAPDGKFGKLKIEHIENAFM